MSEDGLEDKALALVKSRPNGVLQSDLWKDLDIDSRKCSRVIARLEVEGKIKRTWETVKGTRTYRISYMPQKKEAPKKEVNFDLIMAETKVAPCIGCTYECEPDYCPDLGNWVELLTRAPAVEEPQVEKEPPVKVREEEVPEVKEVVRVKGKKAPKEAPKPVVEPIKEVKPVKAQKKVAEVSKPVKAPKVEKEAKVVKQPKPVIEQKKAKPEPTKPHISSKVAKKPVKEAVKKPVVEKKAEKPVKSEKAAKTTKKGKK